MTLKELRHELNKHYQFDVAERNRSREYSYARKVFCKMARELGFTYQSIGDEVGLKHEAALYHSKDIKVITQRDKKIFNQVVRDNKLKIKLFYISGEKKQEAKYEPQIKKPTTYKEALINDVLDVMNNWDTDTINNFIHTRLTPYERLRKTTKKRVEIEKVKGAKLNNPLKSPMLC